MKHWIKHDRRGAYIVILALIFPACLFVMGTLVDIGLVYATRARLQDVADAAALAGAQSLSKGDRIANDAARFYFAGTESRLWNNTAQRWYTHVSGAPDNRINFTNSRIEFSEDGKSFSSATDNANARKNRYIRVSLSVLPTSIFLQHAVEVFNMDPLDIPTITVQSTAFNEGPVTIFSDNDLTIKTSSATISSLVHTNGNLTISGLQNPTRPNDISASGSIADTSNVLHNSKAPKQSMPKITQYTAEGNTSMLQDPYNRSSILLSTLTNKTFTVEPAKNKPNVFIAPTDGDITITYDNSNTKIFYATFYAPNGTITLKEGPNIKTAYTFTLYGSIVAKKVIIDLPHGNFTINSFETLNPPSALVR